MNLKFKISSIIIIFTIINLSSLQADEDYSFVEWLENIKNIATKQGISEELSLIHISEPTRPY